jgi:hypothetical protein
MIGLNKDLLAIREHSENPSNARFAKSILISEDRMPPDDSEPIFVDSRRF